MDERWVLQLCHGYSGPFLDVARQYAVLFRDTPFKVLTVYLTGEASEKVRTGSASDEVIFLGYSSRSIRGSKIGAIQAVRRIVVGRDCALVIAHRFKPVYVACLATSLPTIGVHHAFGDYRRLCRRLFAHLFRHRLALLGVSHAVRDDMRASLPSWPPARIETLYNRIDIETVQAGQRPRTASRAALGLPQDAWVAGNVGRLHPDKDQATLIRAFAYALPRLPAGSLLAILGSGRDEAALKTLAHELNVAESVRFLGQIPEAWRYFKAFDVFVLSSDHEPFGMVLLEAMAAGLPLICSDCGGGREVVEGIGELFPFGDAKSLAQHLENAALRKRPEDYPARATQRLRQYFSDPAARDVFWQMASIREFAGQDRGI
ncbi:MAG: glycosyltransferase [Azoarcus sp.]|jgi:glycosyltransferase involved in cell wall biosynthesis|nr:glycosyltransferase [Azoarcus sp.]